MEISYESELFAFEEETEEEAEEEEAEEEAEEEEAEEEETDEEETEAAEEETEYPESGENCLRTRREDGGWFPMDLHQNVY